MAQEREQTNTMIVEAANSSEERLLREYHWLTDGAMLGLLTAEQQARMQQVQDLLDESDDKSPAAAAMRQQMRDVQQRLDKIEECLLRA